MSALPLNPYDDNYLTCRLINQQLFQNKADFASFGSAVTPHPSFPPKIITDGTGRVMVQGAIVITGTPSAGMVIATFPKDLKPTNDVYMAATVIRGSAYVANAISIESDTDGVDSVLITHAGTYAGVPDISIGAPGIGASLASLMKAVTVTTSSLLSSVGYAPGDTLTLPAGANPPPGSTPTVLTVTHTQVGVVGEGTLIAARGTGGTPGAATVTGTTGTGTHFQASVNIDIDGGIIGTPLITNVGDYTVNPTNPLNEPVTGGGLTGCALDLSINYGKIKTVIISTPGVYRSVPSNPVTPAHNSGIGTGSTFNMQWGVVGTLLLTSGNGYSSLSPVTFTGGSPVGSDVATGTIVLSANDQGDIALINAPQANDIIFLDSITFFVEPYS